MSSFTLSAPSKTFLIGEYLATQGGTALIANTSPRFELMVATGVGSEGISSTSPAGKFFKRHEADFANYYVKFEDPHAGTGGLGASSAQYALLLYFWLSHIKNKKDISRQAFSHLQEYISDSWSGVGMRPSGADMLAQIGGGLSVVTTSTECMVSYKWPFENLVFSLFRTGRKLATHLHLQDVELVPKGILQEIADVTVKGLQEANESIFLAGIKSYGETLAQFGFLDGESAKSIKMIYSWPEALAAKGCGAMGADVIMIIHRPEHSNYISNKAHELGLSLVASSNTLTEGIEIRDNTTLVQEKIYKGEEVQP
jgi:hypothetical protein